MSVLLDLRKPARDGFLTVDVHIPVKNEPGIGATLRSIRDQVLPPGVLLNVIVCLNGTTDNTAEWSAEAMQALSSAPDCGFALLLSPKPGRTIALNHCLDMGRGSIIIRSDGDVAFGPGTFAAMITALVEDSHIQMTGGRRGTIITDELMGSRLGQLYRVRQIIQDILGDLPWPIGRLQAVRREVFDVIGRYSEVFFGSEDSWIVYQIANRFGWDAIRLAPGAVAYATPPGNWNELLEQETRWRRNPQRLIEFYPELAEAKASMQARVDARNAQARGMRQEILAILACEGDKGIPEWIFDLVVNWLPEIAEDNSVLYALITSAQGTYQEQATTKRGTVVKLRWSLFSASARPGLQSGALRASD